MTRATCAMCPRSWTTHAARSWRKVTGPRLGCSPGKSSCASVTFQDSSTPRFSARSRANSSSSESSERLVFRVRWRKRSYGSKRRLGPCARIMRARGIQSVSSPSIKWPMLSKGLNVSGPSVPRAHSGPAFCSSARNAAGVRPRTSIALRTLKSISESLSLPVEPVQDAVEHRCKEEARHDQEHAARIQRIDPREQFAVVRKRRLYGTHAAEQHRGVEKRVAPREV